MREIRGNPTSRQQQQQQQQHSVVVSFFDKRDSEIAFQKIEQEFGSNLNIAFCLAKDLGVVS